uniref:Periplasmic binding protein n=1 Tax=mine drainage metagenome TaxID=410659 RepID=E6Q2H6_9ZZZZ
MRGDPRVVALEPCSFTEVLDTIRTLGSLTGRASEAASVAENLVRSAEEVRIRAREALRNPPSLLFLEWSDPPFAAGHWTPDLLEMLGIRSTIAFPRAPARAVTWEEIATSDPDCIAIAPCGFDLAKARRAVADLDRIAVWRELRAVREGRVLVLDGNAYFNRPGVRLVEGTERLLEALSALEDARYRRA